MNKDILTWLVRGLSTVLLSVLTLYSNKLNSNIEILNENFNRVNIKSEIQTVKQEEANKRIAEHDKILEEILKTQYEQFKRSK